MPSTRDIRRRIKSVKNTAQITKAMQMVAASKMRKAQQNALAGRPYAALMNEVLGNVVANTSDFSHPLTEKREGTKRCVIVVSTDKGLCGGLNANLAREIVKLEKDNIVFISAGRKAAQFLVRTKRKLVAEFTYKDAPLFTEARAISRFARDLFIRGDVDRGCPVHNFHLHAQPKTRDAAPAACRRDQRGYGGNSQPCPPRGTDERRDRVPV
jgi:F-type H+-transporting ATPase subunit gamma